MILITTSADPENMKDDQYWYMMFYGNLLKNSTREVVLVLLTGKKLFKNLLMRNFKEIFQKKF